MSRLESDLSDAKCAPGQNYCEWVDVSKTKLKERETSLVQIRGTQLQNIVNAEIDKMFKKYKLFNRHTHTSANFLFTIFMIESKLIDECLKLLFSKIDEWSGVDTFRLKTEINTFKEYYLRAKNNWDTKKKDIYAQYFWLPIFVAIYNKARNLMNTILNDNNGGTQKILYFKCLLHEIFCGLFCGQIHVPRTKALALIQEGCVKDCDIMHQFLFNHLDNSLNVSLWKKNQNNNISAKDITQKLQRILFRLRSESNHKLSEYDNQRRRRQETQMHAAVNLTVPQPVSLLNINYVIIFPAHQQLSFQNQNSSYNGSHGSSYSVSDNRFNPMNGFMRQQLYQTTPVYLPY